MKESNNLQDNIVSDVEGQYKVDLDDRLIKFSVAVIRFVETLPSARQYDVFRFQLTKSATSIGANFQEAQSATYKEFIAKLRIALREANETKYWLRVLNHLLDADKQTPDLLLDEVTQLAKILGAIVSRADKKIKNTK